MMVFEAIECAKCSVVFGITAHMQRQRRETGAEFFCPNGHSNVYRESDADKYRRERDRLQQRLAQKEDEIEARSKDYADAQKEITRLRKRAAGGTCPCCNRSFANMARHMKTKHPEVATVKEVKA